MKFGSSSSNYAPVSESIMRASIGHAVHPKSTRRSGSFLLKVMVIPSVAPTVTGLPMQTLGLNLMDTVPCLNYSLFNSWVTVLLLYSPNATCMRSNVSSRWNPVGGTCCAGRQSRRVRRSLIIDRI
jgi:hypothetical protein